MTESRLEYHRRIYYTRFGRCLCWYYDYQKVTECLNCARERRERSSQS